MSVFEVRGGRLTPASLCKRYSKDALAGEYLRLLDEYARLAERHEALLDERDDRSRVRIGFSRFQDGGVEMFVWDLDLCDGVGVEVGPGDSADEIREKLRALHRVLPDCVVVRARHMVLPPRSERGCTPRGQE